MVNIALGPVIAKVLSLTGILFFSLFFGLAPLFIEKFVRSPKIAWVNNAIICFSGGTLLGITFLHLMPETRQAVNLLTHQGYFSNAPPNLSVADVIICGGFFFIYIFDEMFHMLLEWAGADHIHQPHGRRPQHSVSVAKDKSRPSLVLLKDEATSSLDVGIQESPQQHTAAIHIPSVLTIVALSFHDIFEGLALGIQEHTTDVVFLFISVATHKFAISFSVSLDLLISGATRRMVAIYTLCFSLVNPIGIAVGIVLSVISDQKDAETPMTVMMQGVASGSLIYVVCFEVLQRHGSGNSHAAGVCNTLFVILGFIFTLLIKIWTPHNHHHED